MNSTSDKEMVSELIQLGIERLKRLGFEHVTKENILSDKIYSPYFHQMLIDMIGISEEKDRVIKNIFKIKR